jgi:hypothetical protein
VVFPRVCWVYAAAETSWLAGCYWWYNTSTYALTEFDIAVAQKFHWCYTDSPQGDTYDFQSTLTHEFGHTIGINDLYKYYDDAKTMYGIGSQASTKQRSLEQDDKDAIAYLYPADSVDKVWIKTATDDYGVVKYPGSTWWNSPDISLKPDPPVLAEPCSVFVTARNMRPGDLTGRIIIEVHDPDVSLRARTSVLYADTLDDKKMPSGNHDANYSSGWNYDYWANSKRDGETAYVFIWTPDSNTFGEDHYCFVATVECGSDTLRDLDVPDDNNIACHNFHTVKGGSGGSGQMLSFDAGNPTGVAVWRHLYLDNIFLPAGWLAEMPPFPDSMFLTPVDTFWPVPVVITPLPSAMRGDYGIVQVRCVLKYEYDPSITMMTGGIIYKLVVGEPGDVGVVEIKEPVGTITNGVSVTPRAMVKNFGATTEIFAVNFKIGEIYSDDSSNVTLAPGESLEIAFAPWTAALGTDDSGSDTTVIDNHYVVSCSTKLNNDWRAYNDKLSTIIEVVELQTAGWAMKESIPVTGVTNAIKDGGALIGIPAFGKDPSKLYAFLGTKTNRFMKYTVGMGWSENQSDSMIFGHKYKPSTGEINYEKFNKKFPGKGASMCFDGSHTIYATKGNSTWEFYSYDILTGIWTAKAFSPSTKALKGGTSLSWYNGKVYMLAGGQKKDETKNFWVYDPNADTANGTPWAYLATATIGANIKPWKDGSSINVIGGLIYAVKGGDKYNAFHVYDPNTNIWAEKEQIPIGDSLDHKWKKKLLVKDGATATTDDDVLYAMKGFATTALWRYTPNAIPPDTGLWENLSPIPIEKIDKKHRPKTGAAMCYCDGKAWLLVGNKQPEFWQYVPEAEKTQEHKSTSIVGQGFNPASSKANLKVCPTLSVNPNPFTNLTTIRYNVTTSGKVSMKLYNSTGKLISTLVDETKPAGSYTFDLKQEIPQGIYFIKYNNGTTTSETKVIVQ